MSQKITIYYQKIQKKKKVKFPLNINFLLATLNLGNEDVDVILDTKDCAEKMMNYFQDSVFYFKNLSEENYELVKKLATAGGGVVLTGNFFFFIILLTFIKKISTL